MDNDILFWVSECQFLKKQNKLTNYNALGRIETKWEIHLMVKQEQEKNNETSVS